MSNISNRHNVNPFVAGKSQPLTGQRLAKIGYKKTAKQTNPLASVCVSVPMIDPKEIITDFTPWFPHLRAMMENAQDGIIRSLYESAKGNLTSVSDDEIGYSAILAYLDAESNGGRLTKEFLASWFDSNLSDNLTVALAEKTGMQLDDDKIVKTVKAYKDMISALSGGKTFYSEDQCKSLLKAVQLSAEDDEISAKLTKRLESMMNQPKMEDLLGL